MGDQSWRTHATKPTPRRRAGEAPPRRTELWRRLLLAALLALLASRARGASPELIAALLATLDRYTALPPPVLTAEELSALCRGEVVRRSEPKPPDQRGDRATGMVLVNASRDAAWLATQDPHGTEQSRGLHELRLSDSAGGKTRWFGLLDLPWPFRDRAWVVEVWDHTALSRATGGRAWEHLWQLDESGLPEALEQIDAGLLPELSRQRAGRAVFTPANRGSWTVLSISDRQSLVIFQTETAIGGMIPDHFVARYALAQMQELLQGVDALAVGMPQHYRTGHPVLLGGDSKPIPYFGGDDPLAAE